MPLLDRRVKILQKPVGDYIGIGISGQNTKPHEDGHTHGHESSYGLGSGCQVWAAGHSIIDHGELPPTSIWQKDEYRKRSAFDKAYSVGDEVLVTLDCSSLTLRVQSPTVDHTIIVLKKHKSHVLSVNFGYGNAELQSQVAISNLLPPN